MFIYEEFMARSSTRQALTQGANFMGMMNVLMQLRKVCNHPDLFEPRSVVTPLVVEPIVFSTASCVVGLTNKSLANISDSLLCPLWCGSHAAPSFHSAYTHDKTHSDELLILEATWELPIPSNDGFDDIVDDKVCIVLRMLFDEVIQRENKFHQENIHFLNKLNSRRCRAFPFPYPQRLIDTVRLQEAPMQKSKNDVFATPTQLIAMRRDMSERADDLSWLLKRFIFAVPKAVARPVVLNANVTRTRSAKYGVLNVILADSLQEFLQPFRESNARLTTFFPDKKLVQFDAGKLQALAELLRERKQGGHKVLIFTQMSKMLDILETFLNMNGHTYVRLDGGTNIDQRQRLMDRFNNDPKIFCFILSTRSGGTGVNLTGADTVVFYDSDWNPAQDAQAQDRAHRYASIGRSCMLSAFSCQNESLRFCCIVRFSRIGQTREVHIFRLVTEHTIEENILKKAKQKRNLDLLVMDRGRFDASMLKRRRIMTADTDLESNNASNLYTKGGLREILGVAQASGKASDEDDIVSSDQVEKTMTSLEDIDDANALKGSRKEAEEELKEFDETIEYKKDSDADDEEEFKAEPSAEDDKEDPKSEEKELEREIAAWQEKVGVDPSVIEASLSPVERYGIRFGEVVDPYYSIFAVLEYRQKLENQTSGVEEIDINQIEEEKALEENRAFEEGDLLSTNPNPDDLIRQINLYRREKARLVGSKMRRKLIGEDWEQRFDSTQTCFWYNVDTGEGVWDKPKVLVEMESYNRAYDQKWRSLPIKPLLRIMSYLNPFPDRMRTAEVCTHWCKAAKDISFVRHVYPVEMGAYTRDDAKMEYNHFRTIEQAIKSSLPGDTIGKVTSHCFAKLHMYRSY
jgi:Helicase conserved C-terminal domain/F-box-like